MATRGREFPNSPRRYTLRELVFTYTLGGRKLQENEGRLLKLLSGNMMLGLGLALLFAPEMLNSLLSTALLLLFVTAASGLMIVAERLFKAHSKR